MSALSKLIVKYLAKGYKLNGEMFCGAEIVPSTSSDLVEYAPTPATIQISLVKPGESITIFMLTRHNDFNKAVIDLIGKEILRAEKISKKHRRKRTLKINAMKGK
jgi:hypothetical protein